ncbi:hypothetical protein NC652_037948 [Populus alba x Populus x berolinensis]|uniref:Uncharacterized protein n=1 Tax=Populus alba x Populus x berolinensis TaxID=444605 RepID=A0AAD6PSN9_9ROSI|nr:hypothetical protein NC652_037948 [Populus alba x Populus x berolinensis]KAJ6959650.1 hypothetical protein NC653_037878 [Populus alba x Populus x berolinensis]
MEKDEEKGNCGVASSSQKAPFLQNRSND